MRGPIAVAPGAYPRPGEIRSKRDRVPAQGGIEIGAQEDAVSPMLLASDLRVPPPSMLLWEADPRATGASRLSV